MRASGNSSRREDRRFSSLLNGFRSIPASHRIAILSGFAFVFNGRVPGVRDEGSYLCRILVADGRFDASDHIHTPGLEHRDGFRNVFRGEAAGGNEFMGEVGIAEESGGGGVPVEDDAGSADSGSGAGVYEER